MGDILPFSLSPYDAHAPTILVVEDEGLIRLMVADALRDNHYKVVEAVSGDEAARILRSGVQVDVVFTDVRMPGLIDGIALARLINTEFPGIRVLVTSGHVSSLPAGLADRLFSKPYDLASVVAKIGSVLENPGSDGINRTINEASFEQAAK